jgi:dihydrofolate reductase
MKLTVHTFLTLDGVMQGPGGAEEDTSGGFTRGGWLVPYADADMGAVVDSWFSRAEAILLGRTTFTMMRDFWSQITDPEDTVAAALNNLPKYLVSSTVTDPGWSPTTVLEGDPVEAVQALKQQPGGELQVHGSAGLLQTLLRHDLVDELRVLTFPVVLGTGKRLFAEGAVPAAMRLEESRTTSAGTIIAVYGFAGRPSFGTFALEDEEPAAG